MKIDPNILIRTPQYHMDAWDARRKWFEQARENQLLPPGDDWDTCAWIAGRFFGKQLSIDTAIPTPSGWSTMGDLREGDAVFDERGKTCRVVAVHPIQMQPDAWRVRFSDGAVIEACGQHLWTTWTHRDRKQYLRYGEYKSYFPDKWWEFSGPIKDNTGRFVVGHYGPRTLTTSQIRETLRQDTARQDLNHCVPVCRALDLPDLNLPIAPYVLGYWLGNGTSREGSVTTGSLAGNFDDEEISAAFESVGCRLSCLRTPDKGQSRIVVSGLTNALKVSGLLNNKHIPKAYLRASVTQRQELLRGLCDSDGHASSGPGPYVEFCTTLKDLADSVFELVASLGEKPTVASGIARVNGKDYGAKYRVTWSATQFVPFLLRRKAERCESGKQNGLKLRHRMITAIDSIEPRLMRCITVDSPSGLYLAGRHMIPTHNTRVLTEAAWWDAYEFPGIRVHSLAPTLGDVHRVVMEGESGYLNKMPESLIKRYDKQLKELELVTGSLITGFSVVEEANRLRGPQCHLLTMDEASAADRPVGNLEAAYKVASLGVRLIYPAASNGYIRPSRKLIATTPKPIPFLKRLVKRRGVILIQGSSLENRKNVAASVMNEVLSHEGTAYGKQEIYGQFIDEEPDQSVFKRRWFRLWPAALKLPEFSFILEVYDTAYSEATFDKKNQRTDPTACIVLGVFNVNAAFTEAERRRMGVRSKYGVILCDAWAEHLGFPELLERARTQHRIKWGTPGRRSDVVLIEDKGSGISMRQTLNAYGVPTWRYNPGQQSKLQRAHAASPIVNQGMFFVPESQLETRKGMPRDWVEPFLEQICGYYGPGTTEHDDFVDCLSSGISYLRDRAMLEATPDIKYLDPEEKREADEKEALRLFRDDKSLESPYG